MKTTRSNSYLMSRDFEDGRTRMAVAGIQERIRASPEAMFTALFNGATIEFAPDDTPISQDGELWLTELEIYGLLTMLKHRGPQGRMRRVAETVLLECIQAFVDERRNPPQEPELVAGTAGFKCVAPGSDEIFRPHPDAGHELSEVGAILVMIESVNAGETKLSPRDALRSMVEMFDGEHAKKQRITAWSPLGGNGPSHIA